SYPIAERGYPIAESEPESYPIAERGYPIAESEPESYPIAERGYPIAESEPESYPIAERGYPIAESEPESYPIAERGYPIAESEPESYPIAGRGYPIAESEPESYPIAERGYPIAESEPESYPIAERAVGDKLSATFSVLQGTVEFLQETASTITVSGQFTAGISDTVTDNYSVKLAGVAKTFTELGIVNKPPGTDPFKYSTIGVLSLIKGKPVTVSYKGNPLDSAVIG
ncbi:9227_t:CDS:1, partial [Entrophospora sp. SA101]